MIIHYIQPQGDFRLQINIGDQGMTYDNILKQFSKSRVTLVSCQEGLKKLINSLELKEGRCTQTLTDVNDAIKAIDDCIAKVSLLKKDDND